MNASTFAIYTLAALTSQDPTQANAAEPIIPLTLPNTGSEVMPVGIPILPKTESIAVPESLTLAQFSPVAQAQQSNTHTPVTDRFGVTGVEPNPEVWRENLKQRYQLQGSPTPITDRFGVTGTEAGSSLKGLSDASAVTAELWRENIQQRYKVTPAPTTISDRFGATGTEPNAELWRESLKQRYKIGIR